MEDQDYKDFLKTSDILESSQKAKEKSMALLEDQGLAWPTMNFWVDPDCSL